MDAAAREMLRESMKNALAVLSERERQVLELRFGWWMARTIPWKK